MMKNILLILLLLDIPCFFVSASTKQETSVVYQSDKGTQIRANLKQGKYMMSQGNYSGAKAKFQKVLSLDKTNKEAKELIAQCDKKIQSSHNTSKNNIKSVTPVQLSVSRNSITSYADETTTTITVSSNTNWGINNIMANWIHASRNGNNITIKIDKNTSTSPRSNYLVVQAGDKTQRVNIVQEGEAYKSTYLNVSKTSVSFSSRGGTETMVVSCNGDWNIDMYPNYWGHLTRTGNTITLTIDSNESTSTRNDYFVIKSGNLKKTINISQQGVSVRYSSNSYYNPSTYTYNNYRYESWWENRIKFGYNITSFDVNSTEWSWKTGPRVRFGKYSDYCNIIVGLDYSIQRTFVEGGNYYINTNSYWQQDNYYSGHWENNGYWDYVPDEWNLLHHELFMPIEFRLNFANCGSDAKWYLGTGFDFGFRFAKGKVPSNSISYAFDPQFGIMWDGFDLGIDCRIYMQNPSNNNNAIRFGMYGIWYF